MRWLWSVLGLGLALLLQWAVPMAPWELPLVEAARELSAGGPRWLPTTAYVPNPTLAPLPVWLAALAQSLTGPVAWSVRLPGLVVLGGVLLGWSQQRTRQGADQARLVVASYAGLVLLAFGGAWALGVGWLALAVADLARARQPRLWGGLAAGLAVLSLGLVGLALPLLTLGLVQLTRRWPPGTLAGWLALALAPVALWLLLMTDAAFAEAHLWAWLGGPALALPVWAVAGLVLLFGLVPLGLPAALRLDRHAWREPWAASGLAALALALVAQQLAALAWLPVAAAGLVATPRTPAPTVHRPTALLLLTLAVGLSAAGAWYVALPWAAQERRNPVVALAQSLQDCGCYVSAPPAVQGLVAYHARTPYLRSQPGSGVAADRYEAWLLLGPVDAPVVWLVPEAQTRRLREQPGVTEVRRLGDWVVLRRERSGSAPMASR